MSGLPYLRKLSLDDFKISVILSFRVLKYGNISQKSWKLNTRTFSFQASCASEFGTTGYIFRCSDSTNDGQSARFRHPFHLPIKKWNLHEEQRRIFFLLFSATSQRITNYRIREVRLGALSILSVEMSSSSNDAGLRLSLSLSSPLRCSFSSCAKLLPVRGRSQSSLRPNVLGCAGCRKTCCNEKRRWILYPFKLNRQIIEAFLVEVLECPVHVRCLLLLHTH